MFELVSRARGSVSFFASTLVFFNYLFFLKWYPFIGSRKWVVVLICLSLPLAFMAIREHRRIILPLAILSLYAAYTAISFFLFGQGRFDPLYLWQFLLSVLPFFVLGALSGLHPRGIEIIVQLGGTALFLAIGVSFYTYGTVWDGDRFRDILHLPRVEGRTSFLAYYQLTAFGVAMGSIPLFVRLLAKVHLGLVTVLSLALMVLLAELGSRGVFLILPIVFVLLVFRIKGHWPALAFALAVASLALLIFYTPAGKNLMVVERNLAENASYEEGRVFHPGSDPYVFEGNGQDRRTWSRRTLFAFAYNGWTYSTSKFLFGHGLGSFSLDLAGVYPSWIVSPRPGSIYPHNWILEAGYEGGIMAVFLLGAVLMWPFIKIAVARDVTLPTASIIGIYLFTFCAAFLSGGIALNYTLFFLCGASFTVIGGERSESKSAATGNPPVFNGARQ